MPIRIVALSLMKSCLLFWMLRVLPMWAALSVNLILAGLIARYLQKRVRSPLYPLMLFLLEAVAPVFSTFCFLFTTVSFPGIKRVLAGSAKSNYRMPFGEEHYRNFLRERQGQILHESSQHGQEKNLHETFQIEPYIDIIEGSDLDLKINAIGKLSSIKTRESITLLKLALQDEHYEVKYFASNSLSLMEKAIVSEIESYDDAIARYPNDYQKFSLRGLTYLNMYYLGLIDQTIGRVFLEKALNDFLFSLQLEPSQEYLYVKILEVYNHKKDFSRVLELSKTILEKDLAKEDRVKILFYQAEAHFHDGNFQELAKDCQEIRETGVSIPLMEEAVEFWRHA